MSIDDYSKRVYTSTREKELRRFTIRDQDDIVKSFTVNISQFEEDNQIGLCKIFHHLEEKGLPWNGRSFYLPKEEILFTTGTWCRVPFETLADKQIEIWSYHEIISGSEAQNTIRMDTAIQNQEVQDYEAKVEPKKPDFLSQSQQISQEFESFAMVQQPKQMEIGKAEDQRVMSEQINYKAAEDSLSPSQVKDSPRSLSHDENKHKRVKQPERKIYEVIAAVRKWRTLYESYKVSLTKGAEIVGISKKSLDDYFLVLRIAEIFKFDFENHLDQKMGDLRSFIRSFDTKITGKLTKKVKCFEIVPQLDKEQLEREIQEYRKSTEVKEHRKTEGQSSNFYSSQLSGNLYCPK